MYLLEEWEVVQDLKDKTSYTAISKIIGRGPKFTEKYGGLTKDEILSKIHLYSLSKPRNIKPTRTFPELYVTNNGEFVYKAKKYWYLKPTLIAVNNTDKNGEVSIYWAGKYRRAHRLVAEAWFDDLKNYKYILFKDDNKKNIKPSNLLLSNTLYKHRCEKCGRGIPKPPLCKQCEQTEQNRSKRKVERMTLALQIEEGIRIRHKKLTDAQKDIVRRLKNGDSVSQMAKDLNVTRQATSAAIQSLKIKAGLISNKNKKRN